jgi:hypothetical protein
MKRCDYPDHFTNLLIDGKCWHCERVWGLGDSTRLNLSGEDYREPAVSTWREVKVEGESVEVPVAITRV